MIEMSDIIETEMSQALTKVLGSTVSELSQVIADKVRFLRWQSAVRTLEKAKEFAAPYGGLNKVPPLKFFLPFMETCSLEEGDDDVVDMWANLLVSASTEFKSGHLLFMRILRELTGSEARLLRDISHGPTGKAVSQHDLEYATANWSSFSAAGSPLETIDISNWELAKETVFSELQMAGVAVEELTLSPLSGHENEAIEFFAHGDSILDAHDRISLDILLSLNLVERVEHVFRNESKELKLIGTAICTTAMGAAFYVECSTKEAIKNP